MMTSLQRFLMTKRQCLLKKKSALILHKLSGLGTNKLTCWHKNLPQAKPEVQNESQVENGHKIYSMSHETSDKLQQGIICMADMLP